MQLSLPRLPTPDELQAELERRKLLTANRQKLMTYWDRPAAFATDFVSWNPGEGLAPYQAEALDGVATHKRYALRGPHGLGKTMMAALAIHWFALTRDGLDWKLPTTASVWRQLSKFLWPEVHKWARRLRWDALGRPPYLDKQELLTMQLNLSTGSAFALASDRPSQMEGAHADHLFYLFDEAKTIPGETFDAAEGAFTGGGLEGQDIMALAISTPGDPYGRFYDIHACTPGFEDWTRRHVTLAEAVAAKRVSVQWAEARKRQWGATSSVYLNRVEGEFAGSDENSVIPLAWVEAAVQRWQAWRDGTELPLAKPLTSVGADIAREGTDRTVFALRKGLTVVECRDYPRQSLMETTGHLSAILRRYGGVAAVDVIGIGAGVVDRLRELKLEVLAFNAGATAKNRFHEEITDVSGELRFLNLRSAAWWHLRELLDPSRAGDPVLLPPDDALVGELVAPRWGMTSNGRIQIESKDALRKPDRLGRSTDYADAVVMAFAMELVYDPEGYDVWGGGDVEEETTQEIYTRVVSGAGFFPGDDL